MDEATLIKFGKWINCDKSHPEVKISSRNSMIWVT